MIYTGKFYRAELYQDNTYPYTNVKTIYDAHKDDYPGKKLIVTNAMWYEGAKAIGNLKIGGRVVVQDWQAAIGFEWSGNEKPKMGWSAMDGADNFFCVVPALMGGERLQSEMDKQTAGVKRLCARTWLGFDKDGLCTIEVSTDMYTLDGIVARMQSLGIVDGMVLDGSGSSQWCDGTTRLPGDGRQIYGFLMLWFEVPSSGSAEPPSPPGKAGKDDKTNNETVKTNTTANKEAGMSNSPLVKYTAISPNKHPRTHAIDTITIHHVVGQCSVEQLGARFAPASRKASSNYGVGADGRVGMYVEEKDRAWTSSSTANDDRAVTIEVADDAKYPYKVGDAAYKGLIELCADICRRNGIPKLLWRNDKSLIGQTDRQNMTVHRWFASTACPGDWLMEHMGEIAEEVNKKLDAGVPSSGSAEPPSPPGKAKKDDGASRTPPPTEETGKVAESGTRTVYRVMEVTPEAEKLCKQLASHTRPEYAEKNRQTLADAGKLAYVKGVKI